MPTIDVPPVVPRDPEQPESPLVFCAISRGESPPEFEESMVFLLALDADAVASVLQDMQLVRVLNRVRDHIEGLRAYLNFMFYEESEVQAEAELFEEEHPNEPIPDLSDLDRGWMMIPPAFARRLMELRDLGSMKYTIIQETDLECFAAERYSGSIYGSPYLPVQMFVTAVSQPLISGDLPVEARPLLDLWGVLRAACWSDVKLDATQLQTMPDGSIRIEARLPCLLANRIHMEREAHRLRLEHPDLHIDYHGGTAPRFQAAVTAGGHYHMLSILFDDPDAQTAQGRELAARAALAELPVPLTGDAATGAARVLAGLSEDEAAKMLGVAILQGSRVPTSGLDRR